MPYASIRIVMKRCPYKHCVIYKSCDQSTYQVMYCKYVETLKRIVQTPNLPRHEQIKIKEWMNHKIRESLRRFSTKQLQ
jgi:hypothetical protein